MLDTEYNDFLKMKNEYESKLAQKKYIEERLNKLEVQYSNKNKELITLQKTNVILNNISNVTREAAKKKLESIVTNALQYIYEKDIEFKIILDIKRGVPSAEFKIVTTVDGVKSEKDPVYSNGGGVVDVVSTALRYSYLISIDDNLANIMILDEPGKMVSEGASEKYAKFIEYLSSKFDIQTILITHNNNLGNITPNVFEVTNVNNNSIII